MSNKNKNIKIAILSGLALSLIAYIAITPYNLFAKNLFNFKYKEESNITINALNEIKDINTFSKNDIINYHEFILFSFNYPIDENNDFLKLKTFQEFDKKDVYNKFVIPNQKQIDDALKILERKSFKYINKRDLNEQTPSFQSFSITLDYLYVDILNKLKEDPKKGIEEFQKIHEAKLEILRTTNYLINNLYFIDFLNDDIDFALYVKETYNIDLKIKPLTKDHYDFKEAFINEKQLAFNFVPDVVMTAQERFYMNEIYSNIYKEIQEFFALSLENDDYKKHYLYTNNSDNYQSSQWELELFKVNSDIGYIEEKGAPISTILLKVSIPSYSSYKDEYREYVKKYNENFK